MKKRCITVLMVLSVLITNVYVPVQAENESDNQDIIKYENSSISANILDDAECDTNYELNEGQQVLNNTVSGNQIADVTDDVELTTVSSNQIARVSSLGDTYYISTADDFLKIAKQVNAGDNLLNKTICFKKDIDMQGLEWPLLGDSEKNPFMGSIDGGGHVIKNIKTPYKSFSGVIGYMIPGGSSSIKDIRIENAEIQGMRSGGLIGAVKCVGDSNLLLEECEVSGSVKGAGESVGNDVYGTGGLIGVIYSEANSSVKIDKCGNNATVFSQLSGSSTGGIIGNVVNYCDNSILRIYQCFNHGKIEAYATYSYCTVSSGGLIGNIQCSETEIYECFNDGAVEGTAYYARVGGLFGNLDANAVTVFALLNSYVNSQIKSTCTNGSSQGGGLIGHVAGGNFKSGEIENCYVTGSLNARNKAGLICWYDLSNEMTVRNCYFDRIKYGLRENQLVCKLGMFSTNWLTGKVYDSAGMTTEEMRDESKYLNWDWQSIWAINEDINDGYPCHRWYCDGKNQNHIRNQEVIDRVSEYTSDEIFAQFKVILENDYSYEVKYQMWLNLFTHYGITDVREGIEYLSNTTDKRYAYLFLTDNQLYCASNFQYMLDHTAKGLAMRVILLADGLVFNGELNDWMDFTTYADTEFPGVAKYKAMLYDFMDSTSQSIEIVNNIKLVSDLSSKATGAAKLKADELIRQLNNCKDAAEAKKLLESSAASEVWLVLSEKQDGNGNAILSYELDEESGFGQFEKAMGYATKSISLVDMTVNDILDFMTLDSKLAVYSQYKRFLLDIWQSTEYVPYQMRWAAALIYEEIEEGYKGKIKDVVLEIIGETDLTAMVKNEILESVGGSSFVSWLKVIDIEAFFINKITDIGEIVKREAYVEGYAYLSDVFTKQLEDSKQVFLNDRTAENAWDFYYNYNILYELRCKGEEAYLKMSKVEGIASYFSDFGYSVKEEVVNDTLKTLKERCQFTLDHAQGIPESCQFAMKSVISCPVNVEVYTVDGTLIATLNDGEISDVTNAYGRFAVVFDSYSGDYVKVVCLNNKENYMFRLIGADSGLVNMDFAQAGGNNSTVYTFNNVPIYTDMVIETNVEQIIQQQTYNIDKDGDGIAEDMGTILVKDNTYKAVNNFSLSQERVDLQIGESIILQTMFTPYDASNQSVFWLSSDSAVVTVKDGKVTAASDGEATVYCTSLDAPDIVVSCQILVHPEVIPVRKISVVFDANGGKCNVSQIELDENGIIDNLPSALRNGYMFKGWFTELNGGEKVTRETVFSENKTLYAQWIIEKDDNDDTEKDSDESNSVKENDSTHNKDNTQNKNNIQNGDDMQNIKQPESDRKEYSDLSEHDSIKNSDIVIASEKEKVLDTVPETGDNNRFVNLFVFLGTAVTLFYFIRTFKEQPKNR